MDLPRAFHHWFHRDLEPPRAFAIRDFASFHKVFGRHLNDRVWLDYREA